MRRLNTDDIRVKRVTSHGFEGADDAAILAEALRRRRRRPKWLRPAVTWGRRLAVTAVIGGAGWWLWSSGTAQAAVDGARSFAVVQAGALGLAVKEIYLEGRYETKPGQVLGAMAVDQGAPMLSLDLDQMRLRLEQLPWVERASIERRWPDTLYVRIRERQAAALWQVGDGHILVDRKGALIEGVDVGRFAYLPVVVGDDAPQLVAPLLDLIETAPDLADQFVAGVRVGGRRWDVHLKDGVVVRLPATGAAAAWQRLAAVEKEHGILERAITAVDLRIAGQFAVRLTDAASLAERMKPVIKRPPAKAGVAATGPGLDA
ncbi:FtsQ-type POTRA domain-containing protein [Tistrella bauzanensis]|uniref:Cell division protein FtsQ n=1 Tax=Tistrella arctica TaxID=3133430 RepID=A0ABU9YQZ2_9PROT